MKKIDDNDNFILKEKTFLNYAIPRANSALFEAQNSNYGYLFTSRIFLCNFDEIQILLSTPGYWTVLGTKNSSKWHHTFSMLAFILLHI